MQLEDYFEFFAEDNICIKGHRIGLDDVIEYYLQGYSAEEILTELPTLNLEKIYAALTYYHHNQAKIDAYLLRLNKQREQRYQEWSTNPSSLIQRLRTTKEQRAKDLTKN